MESVEDVMQYPSDKNAVEDADEDQKLRKLRGNIELSNVSFGYSKLSDPLIEDFSMTIKPGGRVAFVGTSGCGKSTLSKLISGLYQPWKGEILFDGKPRQEHPRSVMTGSLAVADQDITIFEGTIADNIKMWDESIKDFEMILAARGSYSRSKAGRGHLYAVTLKRLSFRGRQAPPFRSSPYSCCGTVLSR